MPLICNKHQVACAHLLLVYNPMVLNLAPGNLLSFEDPALTKQVNIVCRFLYKNLFCFDQYG